MPTDLCTVCTTRCSFSCIKLKTCIACCRGTQHWQVPAAQECAQARLLHGPPCTPRPHECDQPDQAALWGCVRILTQAPVRCKAIIRPRFKSHDGLHCTWTRQSTPSACSREFETPCSGCKQSSRGSLLRGSPTGTWECVCSVRIDQVDQRRY